MSSTTIDEHEYSETLEKKSVDTFDFPTILAMLSLIAIGLISIYSATYEPQMSKFFMKQLIYSIVGLGLMTTFIFLPQHFLRSIAPIAYGASLLLLVMIFIPGLGLRINGQICWMSIGGVQFQPSEFAKLSTLLMIGRFMESKGVTLTSIRDVGWLSGIILLPTILVLAEKDTGTASVFIAMMMGTMLWCGGDLFLLYVSTMLPFIGIVGMYGVLHETKTSLYVMIAVASAGAIAFRRSIFLTVGAIAVFVGLGMSSGFVYHKLPEHQQSRIRTYFDPEKFPKDEGYHVLQSMMAVGSGGLTGKGYMKGTLTQLRYIPEQWTDFIYDVPGEEFGFAGSVTVLGLLLFLILRLVRLARNARNAFESAFSFGMASVILYHTIVNIGMAIGLVPVMGIPLPYLSSGGTALMANMTAIGIVIGFNRSRLKSLQQA